jgi:hypothetical protein
MENTPISIFYIACGLTALITLLQLREASQINRFFAGAAILAASAAAFYSRSDTSEFGYFIMAGLLMSLIGSMLLGIRRNKAAAVIGAVLFIVVNILYLAAFRINARAEFASKPFDIVFFAALVVFLDFGGLAFFAGEKRFALRNLPLLANIIIAAFTASSGVSLGFKYLSDSTNSIILGLMLVLGLYAVCIREPKRL